MLGDDDGAASRQQNADAVPALTSIMIFAPLASCITITASLTKVDDIGGEM
jgi:hypothetical protein